MALESKIIKVINNIIWELEVSSLNAEAGLYDINIMLSVSQIKCSFKAVFYLAFHMWFYECNII